MTYEEFKYPVCSGENCPLKKDCARFKRDINKSKEDHLEWPPYNHSLKRCNFFLHKERDPLVERINQILKDADKN